MVSGGGSPAPTCSFSNGLAAPGPGTATLTVNTANTTPDGVYTITVVGTDQNDQSPSTLPSITLQVQRPPAVANTCYNIGCNPGTDTVPTPIYINVFWDTSPGQWDIDVAGIPGLSRTTLDAFTAALVHSQYFSLLAQYTIVSPTVLPNFTANQCGAVPPDLDAAHSQLGAFATCVEAMLPFAARNGSGIINVFLPPTVGPKTATSDFCATFNGEHDEYGSPIEVTFIPTSPSCNSGAAAVYATLTHEMVEAATDAVPNSPSGWKQPWWNLRFAPFGPEIGDVCETLVANPFLLPTFRVAGSDLSQFWSNSDNACTAGVNLQPPVITSQRVCGVGRRMQFFVVGTFDPTPPWDLADNLHLGSQTLYTQANITGSHSWSAGNIALVPNDDVLFGPIHWSGTPPNPAVVEIDGFDTHYGFNPPPGSKFTNQSVAPGDTIAVQISNPSNGQTATATFTAPLPSATVSKITVQPANGTPSLFVGESAQVNGIVADAGGCAEQVSLQLSATAGTISATVSSDESGAFTTTYTAPAIAGPQTLDIVTPFQMFVPLSVFPVMSSLQPAIGTVSGGQPVTLQGSGFAQNATSINFKTVKNVTPAQGVQVASSSQVNFVTPQSPLPGDGTGTAFIASTVNGVESFALEYLYVVPGKPVLNYDPPHFNPLNFQCTSPALTVNAYTANGQSESIPINLSAPYPAFPSGSGTTNTATITSGQTITMVGTGPITAANAQSPSLTLTEQFPYVLLPPPQCSQRTFPVQSSAGTFVAHAVSSCASCSPEFKANTTVWSLSDNPAQVGLYVGIQAQGMENPADEFDVQSEPVPQAEIKIRLWNGKERKAAIVGRAISLLSKSKPDRHPTKISQYATIHMPLPVGASQSGQFHIVYAPNIGRPIWQERDKTQSTPNRGTVTVAHETGFYLLVETLEK